jgi:ABC-type multidrug transport system ATPase subunit
VILSATGLGKRYGSRWLFRRLEIGLERGQVLAVTGANGAGKSTLGRILAGLLPASEGSHEVRGEIGYASVELALYPLLSVAEHVQLAADLRGVEARTDELLGWCGLTEARNRPCAQISTGMKARLRLCLALQHRPSLLILDEPGASLDAAGQALVRDAIRRQREQGAVVIATNDPSERDLADLEVQIG